MAAQAEQLRMEKLAAAEAAARIMEALEVLAVKAATEQTLAGLLAVAVVAWAEMRLVLLAALVYRHPLQARP